MSLDETDDLSLLLGLDFEDKSNEPTLPPPANPLTQPPQIPAALIIPNRSKPTQTVPLPPQNMMHQQNMGGMRMQASGVPAPNPSIGTSNGMSRPPNSTIMVPNPSQNPSMVPNNNHNNNNNNNPNNSLHQNAPSIPHPTAPITSYTTGGAPLPPSTGPVPKIQFNNITYPKPVNNPSRPAVLTGRPFSQSPQSPPPTPSSKKKEKSTLTSSPAGALKKSKQELSQDLDQPPAPKTLLDVAILANIDTSPVFPPVLLSQSTHQLGNMAPNHSYLNLANRGCIDGKIRRVCLELMRAEQPKKSETPKHVDQKCSEYLGRALEQYLALVLEHSGRVAFQRLDPYRNWQLPHSDSKNLSAESSSAQKNSTNSESVKEFHPQAVLKVPENLLISIDDLRQINPRILNPDAVDRLMFRDRLF